MFETMKERNSGHFLVHLYVFCFFFLNEKLCVGVMTHFLLSSEIDLTFQGGFPLYE